MHKRRNFYARFDAALLIQRMDKTGEVGDRRIEQLIDLAVDTIGQLRQIHAWCGLQGAQHDPADPEADGFAGAVVKFATVGGHAG
ncbi:hypothetical protein D3C87_1694260 [compost metagenome]